MKRAMLALSVASAAPISLTFSVAASAQVGPPIGYATSGGPPEVYLINQDGTGRVLLYRGERRHSILGLDIRPGGGQLAFEDVPPLPKPAQGGTVASQLKVIDYDAQGRMIGSPRTLQLTCRTGSIDYHPTDGTVLYRDCSNRISRLNTTSMTSSDLGLTHNAFVASWLDSTNVLYYAAGKFWKVSTSALGSPVEVLSSDVAGSLDTSTSGTKALSSAFDTIDLIDVAGAQLEANIEQGDAAHFSPDDLEFIYITPRSRARSGGQYLLIQRVDGSGSPANLVGRGAFTAVDWRN